jgi:hypothetical protein
MMAERLFDLGPMDKKFNNKMKGEKEMRNTMIYDVAKKKRCVECGKHLNLFQGYRHPTMGHHYLVCWDCHEKVEISVERWGRFVLWNSFNPDAPDPTFIDNFPFSKIL